MKRLFTLLIAALLATTVAAQDSNNVLKIDESTFCPEPIEFNIDKIGLDRSKNPCSRIKMKVHRMTREDIGELSIRFRNATIELMKRQVSTGGDALVFEMTAKKEVRFYLRHPKYGESNEVSLKIEPNKVYYIEASLNQLNSIIVTANAADVDVYIDDAYMGKTNKDYSLTIDDVLPGDHTLRLQYGSSTHEQKINVQKGNILFRGEVDLSGMRPQIVLFDIVPKNATLIVNGEQWLTEDGSAYKSLSQGVYHYVISADMYHTKEGEFVVKAEKVTNRISLEAAFGFITVPSDPSLDGATIYIDNKLAGKAPLNNPYKLKSGTHTVRFIKAKYKTLEQEITINDKEQLPLSPTLEPNFAVTTLNVEDKQAEIYINGEKVGVGTWTGELEVGDYDVVCKREGHRDSQRTVRVYNTDRHEEELPTPLPIFGRLMVTCKPNIANVTIDGVEEQEMTPFDKQILVGEHKIVVSKAGYVDYEYTCQVSENETTHVEAVLSQAREVEIACSKKNASVYIDHKYVGKANQKYLLALGEHEIKVTCDGCYDKTEKHVVTSACSIINMGTLTSKHSWSSGSSSKSSSSSSSSNINWASNGKTKKGGFNIGISANALYDAEYETWGYEVGATWRLWRYNSRFNATIGASYKGFNDIETGYISFPATLNVNIVRTDAIGWYVGAGYAYDLALKSDYINEHSLLFQTGFGARKCDVKFFVNYYFQYNLVFYGLGATYYF